MRIATGFIVTALICYALSTIPYEILREERTRVLGEQKSKGLIFSKRIEPDADGELHLITFRYADVDGVEHIGMANMPAIRWEQLNRGDLVTIFFARANPTLVRVQYMIEPAFQVKLRNWLKNN